MFGESESESPRAPSPWDSLISTPPTEIVNQIILPRLVPEAEEGNIEYKLQLLSPSPARFARLTTQLKWRLLEGGGQAYYELGVADSGALIGLPRNELEQSLETLEEMAGEIGASVFIVKEIEVPAALAGLAGSETDSWNIKLRRKRAALTHFSDSTTTETETEEVSAADNTDTDEDIFGRSFTLMENYNSAMHIEQHLTIFAMDPEPDSAEIADAEDDHPTISQFFVDLQISSVYKPRPVRRRVKARSAPVDRRREAKNNKKVEHQPEDNILVQTKQQAKSLSRRMARDRRREEKRKALLTYAEKPLDDPAPTSFTDHFHSTSDITSADLVSNLESLHVAVKPTSVAVPSVLLKPPVVHVSEPEPQPHSPDIPLNPVSFSNHCLATAETDINTALCSGEPRLIVEVLVVRKLSLDEAFLDFGGFSLT